MNNVIGPITPEDWYTLQTLRRSIVYMKTKNHSKFKIAIKKEEEIYKEILNVYKANVGNSNTLLPARVA